MNATTSKIAGKIPGWAVGAIVIVSLAGVSIGAYLIYKKIKNMAAEKDSKKEAGDIDDDLKKLTKAGKKLTLTPSQISGIANELFTAMNGYGTNYDAVLHAMVRVKNDVDLLAVVKSYGVRELSAGAWSPEPNFKGTLGQAFVEELSAKEKLALNNMLARKGIGHRF
jgi:hypothetical protein